MSDDKTRCKQCHTSSCKLGCKKLLKKNKWIVVFVAFLWLYAVFPDPFMPRLDPTFYTISIVAAVLIIIPVGPGMNGAGMNGAGMNGAGMNGAGV